MKITVQEGEFSYTFDDSRNIDIIGGEVHGPVTTAHEAVDAALLLLSCIYGRKDIAADVLEGEYTVTVGLEK